MIVTVDVGNTNIVLATYKENKEIINFRMSSHPARTSQETSVFLKTMFLNYKISCKDIHGVIISTVIPSMKRYLEDVFIELCSIKPIFVDYKMNLSIKLPTGKDDKPQDIGTDRIVNGVSAFNKYGGPIIIIDYGTANKYDVIDEEGRFVTGITAPGIGVRAEGLFQKAALLNEVELKRPNGFITTETTHSVQAGIVYGVIGETEYMIDNLKKALDIKEAKVIATGGYSPIIKSGTEKIDIFDSDLTSRGLLDIYNLNK